MLKKVLALTLVLALCLGLSTGVWAAGDANEGGGITGEADYKAPLYVVVVPTDFYFAIDPIEMGGEGQVYCGDNGFVFANKSGAPIKVNVNLTMAATSGITIVDSPDDVDDSINADRAEKNIYLGVQAPTAATASPGTTMTSPGLVSTDIEANYDSAVETTIVPLTVDSSTNTATKTFSLALETGNDVLNNDNPSTPSTGNDNTAKTALSLGGFKLYGKLTTYNTSWAKRDLSISGQYEFQALRTDDYDYVMLNNKVAGSHNMTLAADADDSDYDIVMRRPGTYTLNISHADLVARLADVDVAHGFVVYFPSEPELLVVRNNLTGGSWAGAYDYTDGVFTANANTAISTQALKPSISFNTDEGLYLLMLNYTDAPAS